MDKYQKYIFPVSLGLLVLFHIIGFFGMTGDEGQEFANLTPVNLLVSGALIWLNHKRWNIGVVLVILWAGIAGFFVEVAGVQTGQIFGEYVYGPALGPGAFGVPFTMALNWGLLIYSGYFIAKRWTNNLFFIASIGATLMVILDYLIEPIAIHFNFWRWEATEVPIQNYVAWWVISFIILVIFGKGMNKSTNKLAPWLFIVQAAFFASLGFALK